MALNFSASAQGFDLSKLGKILTDKVGTAPKTGSTTTGSGSVSQNEAAMGLKEALTQGISKGADQASRQDGFYLNRLIRIPFPPDAQRVATSLRAIGLGAQVDKFELSLNRGAEDAAKSAKPIFLSAIKSLTFKDVWGILTGEKDAATNYLKRTTTTQLTSAFKPIIQQSLDKVNATRYYTDLTTRYNMIPLVKPVQTDLNQYATDKAIGGLFTLIAQEEANIRENPVARTTELLRRVFGSKQGSTRPRLPGADLLSSKKARPNQFGRAFLARGCS
ncbi:DUF4197 domain-containing protein [Hymenobacter cellulosilyticus]|uniref:DUF4197 domain-containing protein n=1 Tax=Hymenobacter cellulosilyticus TaxID=2932248 RepID=A0A8T9Q5A0_9BACT|nr:DUF4197 domain-containing protein [Hymenobacter cellulosilyticus]UOQ70649.1 DUF4197 domain-containing protein [Hymenobacter cellulosilyticus]